VQPALLSDFMGVVVKQSLGLVLILATILAFTSSASAEQVRQRPYADLKQVLDAVEGFESWPRRVEPGHLLRVPHRGQGVRVASHFQGQTLGILTQRDGARFDTLTTVQATAPLSPEMGPDGQGLAITHHKGFGSNAAFPVGPDGFAAISGRGEGALAVLFDHGQRATGFLTHSDYDDPLGSRSARRGGIEVIFLTREGDVLARISSDLQQGITAYGFETTSGAPDIAGFVILNTDPGGIAVDDILFARVAMVSKMQHPTQNWRTDSWHAGSGKIPFPHAWKTSQNLSRQP
jgi:hypothetical protein